MGTNDDRTMRRLTFGDDHSPGAETAWNWITAQTWPGWTVDAVTVTDPDPEIASLFTHEPLHEFTPEHSRTVPDASGIAEVRHLTTAYDPRIVLCEKHDSDLIVVGARGRGLLKSMHVGSTAEWLTGAPSSCRELQMGSRCTLGAVGSLPRSLDLEVQHEFCRSRRSPGRADRRQG